MKIPQKCIMDSSVRIAPLPTVNKIGYRTACLSLPPTIDEDYLIEPYISARPSRQMFLAATKYFQGNFDVRYLPACLPILDLNNLVMVLFRGGSLQQTSSAHIM